jgi:hypothetical protein
VVTYEGRRWRGQRGRDGARTWRRGVLTGATDGVDDGVSEDGGVAHSGTQATTRDARRVAELSGRGHGRWRAMRNGREAAAVGMDARGPDSALRHGPQCDAAQERGSHTAMAR